MASRVYILLLAAAAMLHATSGQFVFPYDCRANAAACSGAGTCNILTGGGVTAGECSACTTGSYYDCSVAAMPEADLANNCPNCDPTGTYECTTVPGTCQCLQTYTTDTSISSTECAVPRVQATCKNAEADIRIYPHDGAAFTGTIAYMDQAGTTVEYGCPFANNGDKWEYLTQPYAGAGGTGTGCPTATATGTGAAATYQWWIYVQYNSAYTATTDLKISLTCTPPTLPATETTPIVTVEAVNPDAIASTQTQVVTSGVTFTLTTGGAALSGALASGTVIEATFDVEVPAGAFFSDFTVKTLQVANYPFLAADPGNGAIIDLLSEACIPLSAGRIVNGLTKSKPGMGAGSPAAATADTGRVQLSFTAIYFITQATGYTTGEGVALGTAYVRAEVVIGTFARPGGGDCSMETGMITDTAFTDIVTTTLRRRKRQAGNEGVPSDPVVLNLTMVVENPFETERGVHTTEEKSEDSCYNSAAFIVPLALMALLMLVAMAMAFYFCTKVSHSRDDHVEGRTNMAYKS